MLRALTRSTGRIAVEHAALDARLAESFLGLALGTKGDCVVIAHAPEPLRTKIIDWTMGLPHRRAIASGFQGFRFRDRIIWIGGLRSNWELAPFGPVDALYFADAHLVAENPLERVPRFAAKKVVIGGEFAPRPHWFYAWARDDRTTQLVRMPAADVVAAFPDQQAQMLPKTDRAFRRQMDLVDEVPEIPPFMVFAKERLRLRTDKGVEFLSERQQQEAQTQLGDRWRDGVGVPIVSLRPSKAQRIVMARKRWAWSLGFRHFLLLKYRRGGFTTLEQAISYFLAVTQPMSMVATLAHTREATQRLFRIVQEFHKRDPRAPENLSDSKTLLEFANGSYFFTGTARGSGFGRGDTFKRIHGSEVSRWARGPKAVQTVRDLVASLTEAAGKDGEVAFESTPNGTEWFAAAYGQAKQTWQHLVKHGSRSDRQAAWFPIFMRWFDDPANRERPGTFNVTEIMDTLNDRERKLIEVHGLDMAQIAFRRAAVKRMGGLVEQEYPEDDVNCFLTTGHCRFSVDRVLEMLERTKDPIERIAIDGGDILIFEKPVAGEKYVQGVDCSEGLPHGDRSGSTMLRKKTRTQVASIRGFIKPRELARAVVRLGRMYNKALTGVERENHGHAVMQEMTRLKYGRSHLQGGPLFFYAPDRAGWTTSPATRPTMIANTAALVDENEITIVERSPLEQMLTFRRQTTGKYEHDQGCYDDDLFSLMIAAEMLTVPARGPRFIGTV